MPGVVLEGDIVDLRVFNKDDALANIEIFVQTMDHYREIRKNAGMAW